MRDVDLNAPSEDDTAAYSGPLFSQDENGALIVNSDEPASSDEDTEDAEPESDALDAQAPHDGI